MKVCSFLQGNFTTFSSDLRKRQTGGCHLAEYVRGNLYAEMLIPSSFPNAKGQSNLVAS